MAVATKSTTTQAESDIQAIGCGSIADGEIIGFPWVIYAVKDGKFVPTAVYNAGTKGFDKL